MNTPERDLRGDPAAPRTVTDGTRDPESAASSALPSETDPPLPEVLAASLALFRENPEAWHDEWRRNQDFKVALIQRAEKAEAALAAADPALRALSAQWREKAGAAKDQENKAMIRGDLDAARLARQSYYDHKGCAADLDRLCPGIRDEL